MESHCLAVGSLIPVSLASVVLDIKRSLLDQKASFISYFFL